MQHIDYQTARANLSNILQKVCEDNVPVTIHHKNQLSVVLIPLAEYNAIQETFYLLQTPQNAQRLNAAIFELEQLAPSVD